MFMSLSLFVFILQALAEKELGNAAYKSKKFEEAKSHYRKAMELDPTNIVFYNNLAGRWSSP